MQTIAKIIIGIASTIQLLIAILSFFMAGMFTGIFGPGLASLMSILPFILLLISILGFWSIIKNNRAGQFAYSILLALGWPAGTILGIITIVLLIAGGSTSTVKPVTENN